MKIHQLLVELFHAGGRKDGHDVTKLLVAFRNFANAPQNDPRPPFNFKIILLILVIRGLEI